MSAICGIIGKRDHVAVDAMVRALSGRGVAVHSAEGDAFLVAASHTLGNPPCLLDGAPTCGDGTAVTPESLQADCTGVSQPGQVNLRGGFAAVVSLGKGAQWWLMRDRLGRKPLYYFHGSGFLLFASEMKALLASGLVPKRINLLSVDRYLTLRCTPASETMVQEIRRVPPGHAVVFADGEATTLRAWTFDLQSSAIPREAAVARVEALLSQSLQRQRGDYILWSAGLDCAALAALDAKLKPLFVGLERSWQDESRLARESARLMHRPLAECVARRFTEDAFHRVICELDEPLADASVFPLWMVAEAAAEQGRSFITGHGADELLGGYPRYHFLEKARGAGRFVPAGLLSDLMPALPPNAFVRRASRSLASIKDAEESYLSLVAVFDPGEREDLYTHAMKSALHELGDVAPPLHGTFTQPDLTRNVLALDLNVGLPNLLLAKCDRVAAAHGITLLQPYLDDDLIDFVLRLPADVKFGVRSKPLLRLAMKGKLPGPVRLRARRDFHVPQNGRVVRVLENVTRQTITPERVDATGLFRWQTVETLLRTASHNVYRRRQFWALLMFFAWYRNVLEP